MAENLIYTTVAPKRLAFKPGGNPVLFEVNVRNDSKDYASFQLAVEADYDKAKQQSDWYRVSPEIGTFNPPGDHTKFKVELIDSPVPGFVGLMQLRIKVSSVELPDKDTLLLPVNIEQGSRQIPLDLTLPVKEFHKSPGAVIKIPVRVRNLGQTPTNVHLTLQGVPSEWLREGSDRNFKLEAGAEIEQSFTCDLPDSIDTIAKNYPFIIQADHSHGVSSSVEGYLEVLSKGYLDFSCKPKELTIPNRFSFAFWRSDPVTYVLEAQNASNMTQELEIEITKENNKEDNGIFEIVEIQQEGETENITGLIEKIELNPNESEPIALRATAKRPLIGKKRSLIRQVNAIWSGRDNLDTRNENQTIILNVKPIFSIAFAFGSGLFLLFLLIFWLVFNDPKEHQDAVNTVQFNGVGDDIISGSTDQTMIQWHRAGFGINFQKAKIAEIGKTGKMVRVVRYRPVDNNIIAAGLENGEIQLWDLLSPKKEPLASFTNDPADRVLDLTFTKDSRFLFSGHGSGNVLLWDLTNDLRGLGNSKQKPQGTKKFDFSIYGLKLIGNEQTQLAIVGRYNQFVIWNLANGQVIPVNYGISGSQGDYIESLDVSELNPDLAATGDTQGNITIWDLSNCNRLSKEPCGEMMARWQDGHDKQPVRSVALSANGCYLASGGDDGTVKLWYLSRTGSRATNQGDILEKAPKQKKFNSVDLMTIQDQIYVISGNEDHQVRLTQHKRSSKFNCDNF